jgi:hypothetical protein
VKGWISLDRKILKHDIFKFSKSYSRLEAWLWLLFRANYIDNDVCIGNEIYKLKRGQMIISQLKVRLLFGWSNTRLSNFLKLLKKTGSIDFNTNNKMTIVTILKYDTYQLNQYQKQTNKETKTKQKNINNNINKENKEIRESKFINRVSEFKDLADDKTLKEFCNYWTESNMSGTKMKFEMQKTFDIKRRLSKWVQNAKDWNLTPKADLSEFKLDSTGYCYVGYCECGKSDFYKEYELKGDSRCCKKKINPRKDMNLPKVFHNY